MVAVDANRKPVAVPELVRETDEQKQRWERALVRKQSRELERGAGKS